MYKKAVSGLLVCFAILLGYGHVQALSNSEIYTNYYGNSKYTGFNDNFCDITELDVINLSEFPDILEDNTIYVLSSSKLEVNRTITVGNCIAIIGDPNEKDGTLISNLNYSGDIFVINGKYSIIDHINISGDKKDNQYGIVVDNTNSITLHDIKISGLFGGIYSKSSNYSVYDNIQINNIWDYSFYLEDSSFNNLSGIKSYDNNYEGLNLKNSSSNDLKNIELFNNRKQGLYIKNCYDNNIFDIYSHENLSAGIYIDGGDGNKIAGVNCYGNSTIGLIIYSSGNSISDAKISNSVNGIQILGSGNTINNYRIYNNEKDGIYITGGIANSFFSGLIFNNNLNGIELNHSRNNIFSVLYDFNNGDPEGKTGRCGIMLYDNSSENSFTDIHIYNNIIGICSNNSERNIFKNVKTFNNKRTESIVGNLSGVIIRTGIIIKTGILQKELTGKINSGVNSIITGNIIIKTGSKLSFEHMINPHIKNNYLLNWESSYADNIGFKSKFLNIEDSEPEYSIGIMIQSEITGYIISNGINVVADGNINSYNIRGNKYVGNKLKNTLIERMSTGDVRNTVATNINGKDIHAMLVLDTEAPTCKIEYSTTGETTENVIAMLTGCSEEIAGTDLTYTFTKNDIYTFEFTDLVGNSGSTEANVSRIKPKPSGNGGGGGGGGGGGTVNNETNNTTNNSGNNNSGDNNKFTFNTGIFDSDYSEEMNMAYQYAYYYKITTQKSIKDTAMYDGLTRIAMAKMLSYYAINVLKKNPDTSKYSKCLFDDLTPELIDQYDNGGTLSCQLGIMGVGIEKFRPFDPVTRAEFATALSRLLYGTTDGTDTYYSTHLNKLLEKGIIANTDPNLQELRGYVMIMLMRSALGISSVEDFVYPEPEPQEQEVVKYFTEPYKKGQIYSRIGDLQDLLRYLGYYKYGTNYVYSKATINAVYDFQVDMGLIDADDVNNPARGYLGPETRNALNEKWAEFQQYKNGIANQ